jgi:diketogulonate reductase-like aldo/keto reductase
MRKNRFGPLDLRLPVVGLGTWHMEDEERSAALAAIERALEIGMSHLDTAEMYGDGRVEELVGEALRGRRDRAFLVSKVHPQNASRRGTVAACEGSLRRLGTDHLDLYLLHWRGHLPLAPTFEAFEQLVAEGKIGAYGVSNFDVGDLEEARAITGRVVCNQVLYHLEERTIEHHILPWCEAHGTAVVAYSPFGSGRFPDPSSPGGRILAAIAEDRAVPPRAVALAFLTRRPSTFAIPKAAKRSHVEQNAAAGGLVLTPNEILRIEAAFPLGPWRGLQTL